LRYNTRRAQKQYDTTDPDNRLVASELERRWNETLQKVQQLERRIEEERGRRQVAAAPKNGVTGDDGITYYKYRIARELLPQNPDSSPVPENVKLHTFFSPLNNVIVHDHLVGERFLQSTKLIFLTGIEISPESLKAVANRVQAGAICVALPSLVKPLFPDDTGRRSEIVPRGKGNWVITNDFDAPEVLAEAFSGAPRNSLSIRQARGEISKD
jgi:hypothetical protein